MTASTHPWQRPPGTSGSVDPAAADFGYAIEELRKTCDWTRDEVSKRAHPMAYSTVAGIENGHRPPSKRTMGPLAKGLNVHHEELEALWRLFQDRALPEEIDPVWRRLADQAQSDPRPQRSVPSTPPKGSAVGGPRSSPVTWSMKRRPAVAGMASPARPFESTPEIFEYRPELDRLTDLASALPEAHLATALSVVEALTAKARADGSLRLG